MINNRMRGAAAYARVVVESGVMSATPHQLIAMLFDGAQSSIRAASLHMQNGDVVEKGRAVSRALDIVNDGLRAALDHMRGGELAGNLELIYDYVVRQLLEANLRNDLACLGRAASLLEEIGSAWREIGQQVDGY